MLAIQMARLDGSDEELASVGVGSRVLVHVMLLSRADTAFVGNIEKTHGHGKKTRSFMLQFEVFIGELVYAIDCARTGTIAINEITTLKHEIADL